MKKITGSCSVDGYGAQQDLIATERIVPGRSRIDGSRSLLRPAQPILDAAEKVAFPRPAPSHHPFYYNQLIHQHFNNLI